MSKQIRQEEDIYLAPGVLGRYENGIPVVVDERNNDERLDPRDLDDKIKIYTQEVNGWFLEPASDLILQTGFRNSFIVLMVCLAYLEGVEQYKMGRTSNNQSRSFFINSFKRLYPDRFSDTQIGVLYTKARCGLFHNGMVRGGVIFNNTYDEPIEFQDNGDTIRINPRLLLEDIKSDFRQYISELSDSANVTTRQNFNRIFTVL